MTIAQADEVQTMWNVGTASLRTCQGISRRELLKVGGLGLGSLTLADWLAAREAAGADVAAKDVSCIFLWLDGGPSHFETYDPKPDAPAAIRGPYGALRSSVPGLWLSELMPMTARLMHKCALIRSMSHSSGAHSPIPMLTGFEGDTTSYGAVVSKLKGFSGSMPPYVHIGSKLGVGGGSVGSAHDPLEVPDPCGKTVRLPQYSLSADISPERFESRRALLRSVDEFRAAAQQSGAVEQMDRFYQLAFDILTSTKVRDAFDLSREPDPIRERYGANFFGQSCLMARRLVEAGTRFVQIKWYDGPAWDAWDVHGADMGGMERMQQHLCPRLDQGFTALLEDLDRRGMLDSTLIVVVGEFGRTPQINKYGARDHWPHVFSALLAGGGVPRGAVVGASDRQGAQPLDRPVSPGEFAATLYRLMGFNVTTDPRLRPFVRNASPVSELV